MIYSTGFGILAFLNNPCIECGKQRVDGKSWKGKVGTSVITYSQTICPDSACQRIVDKAISDRKVKSALLAQVRMEAKLAKEKLLVASP